MKTIPDEQAIQTDHQFILREAVPLSAIKSALAAIFAADECRVIEYARIALDDPADTLYYEYLPQEEGFRLFLNLHMLSLHWEAYFYENAILDLACERVNV